MYWNHPHVQSTNLKTDQQPLSTPWWWRVCYHWVLPDDGECATIEYSLMMLSVLHLTFSNSTHTQHVWHLIHWSGTFATSTKALILLLPNNACAHKYCGVRLSTNKLVSWCQDRPVVKYCIPWKTHLNVQMHVCHLPYRCVLFLPN